MFCKPDPTSPNFNARIGYESPVMLLLHYTGMPTARSAIERLCDPQSEVSAHYVVDEKGKVCQLVADKDRAWHAGKSYWNINGVGETDINSAAIGIEIVNPGHEFGYTEFSEKQILALIKLCKDLMQKYGISPVCVLGHSDVAPGRKMDPGHLFPWARLANIGIGLWPAPTEMDYQAAEDLILNQDSVHELLCAYGYNPECSFEDVIVAYHRHFYPEKFARWDDRPQTPDILSCARLLALIRQAHEGLGA